MKLKNIHQHSQNLSACLDKIDELLDQKAIAMSKLEYWSDRVDLFNNTSQAITKICQIDGKIIFQENQIEQIINQLNQCINQNQ
jgi:hypothetical protein